MVKRQTRESLVTGRTVPGAQGSRGRRAMWVEGVVEEVDPEHEKTGDEGACCMS